MTSNTVRLPAREIPLPSSISAQARAALAAGSARETTPSPELSDIAGWRAYSAAMNARMQPYEDMVWSSPKFQIDVEHLSDFDTYILTRKDDAEAEKRKVNFFLHGGGWVCFGGRTTVLPAAVFVHQFGGTVYAPDYRMLSRFQRKLLQSK